jgi:hypothetical protein
MSIKLGILASSRPAGGGTNPAATAFFNRVTAAGGTLTITEQNAVNTMVNSLQAAGIYTKFKIIYPMVGASSAACAQNLISSSFTGSFTGGWSFSSNGILGNATNTYMRTNFVCTTQLTASNWHQSYYSRTNNNIGVDCGVGDVAGYPSSLMQIRNASNQSYFVCGNYSNYGLLPATVTDSTGFFVGSILSNTDRTYYRNSSILISSTASIFNVLYPGEIIIGAFNEGGINPRFFNSKQCAFYTIGDGLTTSEANNLYTSVQAFQTTLSRQV